MRKRILKKQNDSLVPFYTVTSPQVREDITESEAEEIVNKYGEALLEVNMLQDP